MKKLIVAMLALFISATAHAQGVVASADPRATEAGREILRQGGSAADAAMAMMLALTVVEPQSSGIGGGGFLLHHDAESGRIETIDGREKAPAAATPQRFLGPDGKPLPFLLAFQGGRSVGVPGNIRLAALTHKKWGKLPWKALFAPAIRLAEGGYQVTRPLAGAIRTTNALWPGKFAGIAALYLDKEGEPMSEGATVRNPELATLLRTVADQGPDAFYTGPIAEAIVRTASGSGVAASDITLADLAAYKAKARPAVCGSYRGYRICGMGPPSSGATSVLQILGQLERFDMAKLGKESPVAWHLIGESMQLAYADREKYLADADFVKVPVKGLIDRDYIARRSALITETASLPRYEAGTPPGARPRTAARQAEVPGTTHFVAIDKAGDIVSMTSTVEGPFGSQLVSQGMVLNNELTDFTFAPEQGGVPVANRVEPGKRPLSSMSPTIVYDSTGKPLLALGSAGGKRIIMHVAKTLVGVLDWGLPVGEAMALPNLYFDRGGLLIEATPLGAALAPQVAGLGQPVRALDFPSKLTALQRTPSGWVGAADPRSVGTAASE